MNEKNFYLNTPRIISIIGTIISLGMVWVIVVNYLITYNDILMTISGCVPVAFITGVVIYIYYYWLQVCPVEISEEQEYMWILDVIELIGYKLCDKEQNILGVCQGVYFGERYISVMADGKLYDLKDVNVYLDENEVVIDE